MKTTLNTKHTKTLKYCAKCTSFLPFSSFSFFKTQVKEDSLVTQIEKYSKCCISCVEKSNALMGYGLTSESDLYLQSIMYQFVNGDENEKMRAM